MGHTDNDPAREAQGAEALPLAHGYDCALVAARLLKWKGVLEQFALPEWGELPDFGLYMDQVLALLGRYLDFIPAGEESDRTVTASTVNNYVRLKIMPAPVKKKYNRVHLAYLLMICTLKQNLSIAGVQKLMPLGLSEDEVRARYSAFAARHRQVSERFVREAEAAAAPILCRDGGSEAVDALITSFAVCAGLSRLLTEKLLGLQGKRAETAPDEPLPALPNE